MKKYIAPEMDIKLLTESTIMASQLSGIDTDIDMEEE